MPTLLPLPSDTPSMSTASSTTASASTAVPISSVTTPSTASTIQAVRGEDEHYSTMHMTVKGLKPYWLRPTDNCIPNNVDLYGIYLLTAPNMSGKSTLMRSTMVVALLANCGLYVPAVSAVVPRYDNYFLRTASYDVPSEGKSAFALELDDVKTMLRDSSDRSLVMVDELGMCICVSMCMRAYLFYMHTCRMCILVGPDYYDALYFDMCTYILML